MVKLALAIMLAFPLQGQTDSDRERRLQELERKVRQLDPCYVAPVSASFDERLDELGRLVDQLLTARSSKTESTTSSVGTIPQQRTVPLQTISVTGDYQSSPEGETRLPIAGYMEAHFNKETGLPGQGNLDRFVLLFGHSFSDRIKFWSDLEIENALVEGGKEKGEIAVEQAYLDFLVKPFGPRELVARVRAVLRRYDGAQAASAPRSPAPAGGAGERLRFGQWVLDLGERELRAVADGAPCALTQAEFRLLETFARQPRRVWTRDQLLEQTRSVDTEVFDRTIDVLILRLRRKIEPNPKHPQYICTERGIGYVFAAEVVKG